MIYADIYILLIQNIVCNIYFYNMYPIIYICVKGVLVTYFCFFFFLGLRLQHIEIPWAGGVKSGGATAASLHHSHSNTSSKPGLRPTPQLTATSDP